MIEFLLIAFLILITCTRGRNLDEGCECLLYGEGSHQDEEDNSSDSYDDTEDEDIDTDIDGSLDDIDDLDSAAESFLEEVHKDAGR